MVEAKYLVSICIPTYNRAVYLKKCLDSLVCQSEFKRGLVEIVISDNASSDQTEELGRAYQLKYSNIKYHRNRENVLDQNFVLALSRGTGLLRKLSNDSSVFLNDSLKILCTAAERYKNEKPILFWGNGNLKMQRQSVLVAKNLDDFAMRASYVCTWIGALSLWDTDCQDIKSTISFCDTHLWQVWELAHLQENQRDSILLNMLILEVQPVKKKDLSYGLFQVFYINYLEIWETVFQAGKISESTMSFLKKDLLYGFFLFWICRWELQRNEMQYSKSENLKEMVFCQYKQEPYYDHFMRIYQKELRVQKIKYTVKSIPLLGKILIRLKRILRRIY